MNPALALAFIDTLINVFSRNQAIKSTVLPLVQEASEIATLDAAGRRKYVLDKLLEQGLSESSARTLIEVGVRKFKKIQEKQAKKEARKAAKKAAKEAQGAVPEVSAPSE